MHSLVVSAVDDYVRRNEMKQEVRRISAEESERYRAALDELGNS